MGVTLSTPVIVGLKIALLRRRGCMLLRYGYTDCYANTPHRGLESAKMKLIEHALYIEPNSGRYVTLNSFTSQMFDDKVCVFCGYAFILRMHQLADTINRITSYLFQAIFYILHSAHVFIFLYNRMCAYVWRFIFWIRCAYGGASVS